eukprot:CAMPEP_0203843516 /NCGR_PEP_ID=MMETSP0359-20131031/2634_1 /ASSEMBLY_ACC=CAM_ASM_000338 /TAXON_ID=268821 /ORGANISM="Scrippsiella Hangoei, Strain SHTV-5" /LENGTH=450 /DNA_ID=CAMNT_0050758291 /DNA_START=18 /DNA_END=1366 /DNA_ORIENTATION=-
MAAASSAKRRRQGAAAAAVALPRVVEEALADQRICKERGDMRIIGLHERLHPPESTANPCTHLEALLRSPHSLQVAEEDLDGLLTLGEQVPRTLTREATRRAYRRRKDDLKSVVHWGQRKLLLSEIEFLTARASDCTRVIYAGAAPGVHIPFLRSLFPHLSFILVDPGDFQVKGSTDHGIDVRKVFFTSEFARELREDAPGGGSASSSKTAFISDVRTADSKVQSGAEVDAAVAKDMAMQREWVQILQPRTSMLKFRLPYAAGETEYFDGEVHLPVWGPATTTEARLITDGTAMRSYNHTEYEEQMFHFNTVTRVQLFRTPLVGAGLCEGYDSAAELRILQLYLESLAAEGLQSVRNLLGVPEKEVPLDFSRVPPDLLALALLVQRVGKESSARGRHLLTILPLNAKEKWFRAKVFDAATGKYLDACSQEGQELLCLQSSTTQATPADVA